MENTLSIKETQNLNLTSHLLQMGIIIKKDNKCRQESGEKETLEHLVKCVLVYLRDGEPFRAFSDN